MLEISVYSHNFDSHKESYFKIKESIDLLYEGYVNRDKIVSLLEYWLFSLSTLYRCYGNEGLEEFLDNRGNDPISYSYSNEFEIQEKVNHELIKNYKLILLINRYFAISYRLTSAPSTSFFSKVLIKYTNLLIPQLPCKYDKNLGIEITKIIKSYLLHFGIKVNQDLIIKNIPNVFVSEEINCNNLRQVVLEAAPIEILQFKSFENIFLLNRKIKLIGYQHGGGYDVASNDPLTYFEKKVANEFIGWGFSEKNAQQTRYLASPKVSKIKNNQRIIWIESSNDSKFTAFCYPVLFELKQDKDIVRYICKEISENGVHYFNKKYPGKLESDRYEEVRGSIIESEKDMESSLLRDDIVIFDNCMHSLMYFCLENEILFLIIEKRDAIQYYTPKMLAWYKLLRKNGLLIHDDEDGLLQKKIKASEFQRVLPKEVHTYYKNVFNPTVLDG